MRVSFDGGEFSLECFGREIAVVWFYKQHRLFCCDLGKTLKGFNLVGFWFFGIGWRKCQRST
jgi:hypothetical protein